ncbi:HAD-IC family P-type ATPase [Blautia sp. RD014234]|nr:HAD-IC family P-type ATPase [Blautia parvula]
MIVEQLNDPMIFILFMAAAISMLLRQFSDTAIIFVVIALNTTVGVIQEGRAKKAMDALKKMTAPSAVVKRDGIYKKIPASFVVPGDLVKIEAGDQVPADIRLIKVQGFHTNESALTGESMPVQKTDTVLSQGIPMAEWKNIAFMSTEAMKGSAEGIVVATGMETELGKIAGMINDTPTELTPLQKRLGDLGKILSIVAVVLCAALFLLGVVQHRNILQMLLVAISLAVAAIPEGLPAVVTIVLALGVARMVKVNTIIRKLPAVETLGSVGIICSDKTGTLTENKMKVVEIYGDDRKLPLSQVRRREFPRLMEGFLLCNNSMLGKQEIGDSTELALLHMGEEMGYNREKLKEQYPRTYEIPFDSERKYMATVHRDGSNETVYVKGACDYLLERCAFVAVRGKAVPMTEVQRMKIRMAMEGMAQDGLRVLALAYKEHVKDKSESALTGSLVFAGMAGMMDPPRKEVTQSIRTLKKAGVQVAMIAGDYKDTALAVAKKSVSRTPWTSASPARSWTI